MLCQVLKLRQWVRDIIESLLCRVRLQIVVIDLLQVYLNLSKHELRFKGNTASAKSW